MTEFNDNQLRLGKGAYEAYAEFTGAVTDDLRVLPHWEDMPEEDQAAWAMVAMRVVGIWEDRNTTMPFAFKH